jgi:hypothetical protein
MFPFIAYWRVWSHEDMENNVAMVRHSKDFAEGACIACEAAARISRRA